MPDIDADVPAERPVHRGLVRASSGSRSTPSVIDERLARTTIMLPPEATRATATADYDMFIWGWYGDPDPNALLQITLCDAIGDVVATACGANRDYDELYDAAEQGAGRRRAQGRSSTRCSSYFYDQAPYHILYYDDELHAYRTDRFAGWQNQPTETATPLFAYGTLDYTLLTTPRRRRTGPSAATPAPSAPGAGAAPSHAAPAPPRHRSRQRPATASAAGRSSQHGRRSSRRPCSSSSGSSPRPCDRAVADGRPATRSDRRRPAARRRCLR